MRWTLLVATSATVISLAAPAGADTKHDCRANKDQDVAIKSCSELIALDPKDADAYFHRGSALALKGDTARAIDDFSKAIEIKPGYARAYDRRGRAYASKGDYEHALSDVTRAGELDKSAGKRKDAAAPAAKKVAAPVPKKAAAAAAPEAAPTAIFPPSF